MAISDAHTPLASGERPRGIRSMGRQVAASTDTERPLCSGCSRARAREREVTASEGGGEQSGQKEKCEQEEQSSVVNVAQLALTWARLVPFGPPPGERARARSLNSSAFACKGGHCRLALALDIQIESGQFKEPSRIDNERSFFSKRLCLRTV